METGNRKNRSANTERLRRSAVYYVRNKQLIADIKRTHWKGWIDDQQFATLYGQVMDGNSDGAAKGLARMSYERRFAGRRA